MRRIYFRIPQEYMGRFIGNEGRMIQWIQRKTECEFKIHGGLNWFIIIGESHKAEFAGRFCHQMIKLEQFGLVKAAELLNKMVREERP
jgi:rRNA processing protein Krr1/Pno1